MAGFYLVLSEFNHGQRDVWMMLPAVAAARYRLDRARHAWAGTVRNQWVFRSAVLEGIIWGTAAWIKPHIILVAIAVWCVTQARLHGPSPAWGRSLRRSAADLLGSLAGGLLVGAAGLAWLLASGTWPHLYEVFTEWNTSYFAQIRCEFEERLEWQLFYFPPWSLFFVAAVPLAILNILDGHPWSANRAGVCALLRPFRGWALPAEIEDEVLFARGVLAALYLAWAAVALALQKHYHYVHVPETLLMLALFAANRWMLPVPVLAMLAAVMIWLAMAGSSAAPWEDLPREERWVLWQYPQGCPNRFVWWTACFDRTVPGELRNGVAFHTDSHAGVNWKELQQVAEYLRSQGIEAGDSRVMCWHDSPHVLYLTMNLRPPIRFMHLSTAAGMSELAQERVRREVIAAAPGVRFVVSDLKRVGLFYPPEVKSRMTETGPDRLPPVLPPIARESFPLNQPAVFRSGEGHGRYIVHRLVNPVGTIDMPAWEIDDPDE